MLRDEFDLAIDNLPILYKIDDKEKFIMAFEKISSSIETKEINVVVTHGDFQPANIIIDSTNDYSAYVIDWEYSKQRYFLYDVLVFEVEARKTIGLAERLKALNPDKFNWICQSLNIKYLDSKNDLIKVFLLEDFRLRIEELQIPTLKQKSWNLENFIKEVDYIL